MAKTEEEIAAELAAAAQSKKSPADLAKETATTPAAEEARKAREDAAAEAARKAKEDAATEVPDGPLVANHTNQRKQTRVEKWVKNIKEKYAQAQEGNGIAAYFLNERNKKNLVKRGMLNGTITEPKDKVEKVKNDLAYAEQRLRELKAKLAKGDGNWLNLCDGMFEILKAQYDVYRARGYTQAEAFRAMNPLIKLGLVILNAPEAGKLELENLTNALCADRQVGLNEFPNQKAREEAEAREKELDKNGLPKNPPDPRLSPLSDDEIEKRAPKQDSNAPPRPRESDENFDAMFDGYVGDPANASDLKMDDDMHLKDDKDDDAQNSGGPRSTGGGG